jgi:ankyrin repeat protein
MESRYIIFPVKSKAADPIPKALILHAWPNGTDLATLLGEHFNGVSKFIVLKQPMHNDRRKGLVEALPKQDMAGAKEHGLLSCMNGKVDFTPQAQTSIPLFDNLLGIVFSNLTPGQIVNASRTNKQFSRMTDENNKTAQRLWEAKFKLHFPTSYRAEKSKPNVNWLARFKAAYKTEYEKLPRGMAALFSIVKEGDVEMLRQFHLSRPITYEDLLVVDKKYNRLINYAARRAAQPVLDFFYHTIILPHYDKDGHLLTNVDRLGNRLLHWATRCNQQRDYIVSLIQSGLPDDINARNSIGATVLYLAAQNGHLPVVAALLANGAKVDAACINGATALIIAAQEGHLPVVDALLKKGANVDAARNDGATPLYMAAHGGHLPVVDALLKKGAKVDAARDYGATALFIAAKNGYLAVVNALLKKGANVNAATNEGETPLHAAQRNKHHDVVKRLQIKLLKEYIKARQNDPRDYKTEIKLFGKKKNVGYSKAEEIAAATKMIRYLKGEPVEITSEDKKILGQGEIKKTIRLKW